MRKVFWIVFWSFICIQISGCSKWVVRTSVSEKPRVDQEVSGNRGFISGKPSSPAKAPTFTKRKVYQVEVEIPELIPKKKAASVKKESAVQQPRKDQHIEGNKGYLFGGPKEEGVEQPIITDEAAEQTEEAISQELESRATTKMRTYQVQKGDTLQKISDNFYGTTKNWPLLYKANRDKLKGPDEIKPGQILIIPEGGGFKK